MSEFEFPPRMGWCTKHGSTTVCKDCTIANLTAQLAAKDEEIARAKDVITRQAKISCKNDTMLWALKDAVLCGDYLAANYIAQSNDITGDLNGIISNQRQELDDLREEIERLKEETKNFYVKHSVGYCGKHGYTGFGDEEVGCLACDLQAKLARYERAVTFESIVYEGAGMVGGRVGTLWGAPINLIGKRVTVLVMEDK